MIKTFLIRNFVGLVALLMAASGAYAQDSTQAPKKFGKDAQVLQGKWSKVCDKPDNPNGVCMTTIDSFMQLKAIKKPVWLATAAVRESIKTKAKTILFRVPLQVQLEKGMLLRIDEGTVSLLPFKFCQDIGCWVVLPGNKKLVALMKKGSRAVLQFTDIRNNTHQVEITLAGFTKAFDGAPVKILARPKPQFREPAKAGGKGDAPAQ